MNSDSDSAVVVDLLESVTLHRFKKHLIELANLATSQEKKYLVWVYLAKNESDLMDESDFS